MALVLAPRFSRVKLWVYEADLAERMRQSRVNDIYLPGAARMQELASNQGVCIVFCPAGPVMEYMPDNVKQVPQTAEDLLYHLPFRYEDRQNPRSLDELKPGETASVIGEVRRAALLRTRKMPIFELTVGQGRHALKCLWFHGHYLEGKFHAGQTVALYGKIEPSRSTSNFKMIQPQFEILPDSSDDAETRLLEVGRITPVYESLGGARLASRWQRKVIFLPVSVIVEKVVISDPGATPLQRYRIDVAGLRSEHGAD